MPAAGSQDRRSAGVDGAVLICSRFDVSFLAAELKPSIDGTGEPGIPAEVLLVIALKMPKSSHSEIAPIEKCDLVHTISYERVPIVSEFLTHPGFQKDG